MSSSKVRGLFQLRELQYYNYAQHFQCRIQWCHSWTRTFFRYQKKNKTEEVLCSINCELIFPLTSGTPCYSKLIQVPITFSGMRLRKLKYIHPENNKCINKPILQLQHCKGKCYYTTPSPSKGLQACYGSTFSHWGYPSGGAVQSFSGKWQ